MPVIAATPNTTPKSSPPSLTYTTSSANTSPAFSAGRSSPFSGRHGYVTVGGNGLVVESDASTVASDVESPASSVASINSKVSKFQNPIYAALVFTACVGVVTMLSGNAALEEEGAIEKLSPDQVTYLPGYGKPYQTQYAGTVTVNPDMHGKLAYWFIEGENPQEDTPVILWLNGGPGASSMTGMLSEMGAYSIKDDGTLVKNPYGWNHAGHLLSFDQPVGTGYSTVDNPESTKGYVKSMKEMREQLYIGLQEFFALHPELVDNPFYISGESYAGKYIPNIAYEIHNMNLDVPEGRAALNLQGILIGNGQMKPVVQYPTAAEFARGVGLISDQQLVEAYEGYAACAALNELGDVIHAFAQCQDTEDVLYKEWAGDPFIYDIRQPNGVFDKLTGVLTTYFNSEEVKAAFGLPAEASWVQVDGSSAGISDDAPPLAKALMHEEITDVPDEIFTTLVENYPILFYAGNMDGSSCNHIGVSRVVADIDWHGKAAYNAAERSIWRVDGNVAGFVTSHDHLTFAVVTNSGHLVPTDQPVHALDMVTRFIAGEPF